MCSAGMRAYVGCMHMHLCAQHLLLKICVLDLRILHSHLMYQLKFRVVSLLLLCRSCSRLVNALYNKPPCEDGETYATLFGQVLCTSECSPGGQCPYGKPPETFADPKCVLEVDAGEKAGGSDKTQPTYCGLVCTAKSYCPRGAVCTKGKPGSIVTQDEYGDNPLGLPVAAEDFKGVCTFKAKKKKQRHALELRLSSVLAAGVMGNVKEKLGIPEGMDLPGVTDKKTVEL